MVHDNVKAPRHVGRVLNFWASTSYKPCHVETDQSLKGRWNLQGAPALHKVEQTVVQALARHQDRAQPYLLAMGHVRPTGQNGGHGKEIHGKQQSDVLLRFLRCEFGKREKGQTARDKTLVGPSLEGRTVTSLCLRKCKRRG